MTRRVGQENVSRLGNGQRVARGETRDAKVVTPRPSRDSHADKDACTLRFAAADVDAEAVGVVDHFETPNDQRDNHEMRQGIHFIVRMHI